MSESHDKIRRHEERTEQLSQARPQEDPVIAAQQTRRVAWRVLIVLLAFAAVGSVWLAFNPPEPTTAGVVFVRMEADIPEHTYFYIWLGCDVAQNALDRDRQTGYSCYEMTRYAIQNIPDPYGTFWNEEWGAWWRQQIDPAEIPQTIPQIPQTDPLGEPYDSKS